MPFDAHYMMFCQSETVSIGTALGHLLSTVIFIAKMTLEKKFLRAGLLYDFMQFMGNGHRTLFIDDKSLAADMNLHVLTFEQTIRK